MKWRHGTYVSISMYVYLYICTYATPPKACVCTIYMNATIFYLWTYVQGKKKACWRIKITLHTHTYKTVTFPRAHAGHGRCQAGGACSCFKGYSGSKCSMPKPNASALCANNTTGGYCDMNTTCSGEVQLAFIFNNLFFNLHTNSYSAMAGIPA